MTHSPPFRRVLLAGAVAALVVVSPAVPLAQDYSAEAARRRTLDLILDTYVRDGFVYYRALRAERARLDRYVNELATVDVDRLGRDQQIAFWLNGYNAVVLRTVIDHYPIQRRSAEYPPRSIRQIPGAFDRSPHRVGGRTLTLDQIEQTVLSKFSDPRLYFAIGRGAVGGGRLRSEAFAPESLEAQLADVAAECTSRGQCAHLDTTANKLMASEIFSWREKEFVTGYADKAPEAFAARSPVERAIIGFIQPKLFTTEREFMAKNTFQLAYQPLDWSLNDLTGRGDR